MGSFLQHCCISHTPIAAGQPVRLVVMTAQPSLDLQAHGFDDETALWQPVCLPLRGVYNDYGGVEDVLPDWSSRVMMHYFQKHHGISIEIEMLTSFLDEHTMFPVVGRQRRDRYAYGLVPEPIYQACVDAVGAIDELQQRWERLLDDCISCLQMPSGSFGTDQQQDAMIEVTMLFRSVPTGAFWLNELVKDPTPEAVATVRLFGLFWLALRRLCILFQPGMVPGDQVPQLSLHQAFNGAIKSYLSAYVDRYDFVDDEEDV